ncbi:MAG: hypothetical protein MJ188_05190 [Treponema sp.]|nr:hypothetical protein [Treponema sp.]
MIKRKTLAAFIASVSLVCFCSLSCASKTVEKSVDSDENVVEEDSAVLEFGENLDADEGEKNDEADSSVKSKSKSAKELKKEIKAQEKAEKELNKQGKSKKKAKNGEPEQIGVSGWVAPSFKNRSVDMIFGSVHMKSKSSLGNFSLSVYDDYKNKSIPVISTANESMTSGYSLKTGNKIIKLNDDTNVKTSSWKNGDEMNVGYRIENVADVIVNFRCYQSTMDSNVDVVKLTATVTNMGIKKSDFALKLVLDTILGETDKYHFYTEEGEPVKNEVLLRDFSDNRFIFSKNDKASMQIFFDGADITPPELVALANYSTLNVQNWEPDLLSFRTFDTILSYSDSAVNVTWPKRRLGPGEQTSEVIYLAFALGENKPAGDELIFGDFDFSVSNVGVQAEYEMDKDYSEFTGLSQEQLTSDYIQKILDRISTLEENDSTVNREELLRLNAELDAILEALRM